HREDRGLAGQVVEHCLVADVSGVEDGVGPEAGEVAGDGRVGPGVGVGDDRDPGGPGRQRDGGGARGHYSARTMCSPPPAVSTRRPSASRAIVPLSALSNDTAKTRTGTGLPAKVRVPSGWRSARSVAGARPLPPIAASFHSPFLPGPSARRSG